MNTPLPSAEFTTEINTYNLFMQAPALICILEGRAGKCLLSNPGFTKLFGGRPLLGRTPREVAPELEGQGYFEMLEAVFDTSEPVYRNDYPGFADWEDNGNPYWKHFNLVYTPYRTGRRISGVMIFGIDVSSQVKSKMLVQQSESQFRELADFIPQIVWTALPDGSIDYFNRKWYEFTGTDPASKSLGWTTIVYPADLPKCMESWNYSITTGQSYELEFRFNDPALPEGYRWFLVRALPLKNEQNQISRWLGTCTDVHESKSENRRLENEVTKRTAELQKVANDLEVSNKDLEQFAAIASHDLKAPLRKITTYVSAITAKQHAEGNKNLQGYLDKIERATHDMNKLVGNLLEFSKVSAGSVVFEKTDLDKIVQESISELEIHLTESKGSIEVHQKLPFITGESTQLKRLFLNLFSNALKFRKPETSPLITISWEEAGNQLVEKYSLDPARKFIYIRIKDNGIGFKMEQSEKIFELFTRLNTGKSFEGTGLGLSICKRIVDNHSGKIFAQAAPQEGAEFHILLPK